MLRCVAFVVEVVIDWRPGSSQIKATPIWRLLIIVALKLIKIGLLYRLLNLLIGEYIFGKKRLEISQELLIFKIWIINNTTCILLAICLIKESILRNFHLFFNHFNRRNGILWKQLSYLCFVILKSFVLIDVEELAELREIVQRFLKLDASVDIEAWMSDFE